MNARFRQPFIGILLAAVPVLPGKKKIGLYSSSPVTK
jgi:hypothetical protein